MSTAPPAPNHGHTTGTSVEAVAPSAGHGAAGLVARALEYDVAEAPALLHRLAAPPAGRRTAWLRAGVAGQPDAGLVVASVNDADPTVGHLELLAVDPRYRRRGVGTALVRAAEERLAALGVREVRWAGNPPCYAWPGIDVRYTPALCAAEALGYEWYREAHNMAVDLAATGAAAADLSTTAEEERLAAAGVAVRAATTADLTVLGDWAERTWNASWRWELEQSVLGSTAGCHVAWRDGDVLAFAGYGANRPRWFGPMGTDPAARNLGLGRVLLRRCLSDMRDRGVDDAQIGWVGPIPFYSRTVGARVDRVFWLYRRTL